MKATTAAGALRTVLSGNETLPFDPNSDGPVLPGEGEFADGELAFGRYRIQRELGRGGMGAVYLARDEQLDRDVALKIPSAAAAADPEQTERFLREARAAATLRHPNLCPIHDAGQVPGESGAGQLFITMAYLPGQSLKDALHGPQPVRSAVRLIGKLADAMAHAHDHGVIHRDLKPGNVMLDEKGRPHITDFGLARREADDALVTQTGATLGTPAYMSPEQILGDPAQVGPRADVYALGVMLYELLTGRLPYEGTVTAVLGKALTEDPPPPRALRDEVDPHLEAIWKRMTARPLSERYGSMREVREALAGYLKDGPQSILADRIAGRPPAAAPTLPLSPQCDRQPDRKRTAATWTRRLRWGLAAAALALLGVVTVVDRLPDGWLQTVTINVPSEGAALSADNAAGGGAGSSGEGGASGGDGEVLPASLTDSEPDADGWVDLLNGRDLAGWTLIPPETWSVQFGELVADFPAGRDAPIFAAPPPERLPQDYELDLEFLPSPEAELKVRVRRVNDGSARDDDSVYATLGDPGVERWGFLSARVALRGDAEYLAREPMHRARTAAWEAIDAADGWQRVRLQVRDDVASLSVNGVDMGSLADAYMARGRVLRLDVDRNPPEGPATVRFRSLRFRPLDPDGGLENLPTPPADDPGWVELFDGETLDGWEGDRDLWSVEDGLLVGMLPAVRGERIAVLTHERPFGDALVRIAYEPHDWYFHGLLVRLPSEGKDGLMVHTYNGYPASMGGKFRRMDGRHGPPTVSTPNSHVAYRAMADNGEPAGYDVLEARVVGDEVASARNGVPIDKESVPGLPERGQIGLRIASTSSGPSGMRIRSIRVFPLNDPEPTVADPTVADLPSADLGE
ncbi:protein kinase domain-containing protein [Alienimonas californiensis]|nr:protein kinase [Alienimonas californiensis]